MANYLIGLDFGTSQTKVCLYNKDSGIREFLKYENGSYFLPSVIVKKQDNTFSYGKEEEEGTIYRYFKMAAAEDDQLVQATNENFNGDLPNGTVDDFKKYSTDFDIKPETLVVLYLAYVYLFVKKQKNEQIRPNIGGLLGRLAGGTNSTQNTFCINLGIPTEWHNPHHINRKIKFQSLLLTAVKLSNLFNDLGHFLNEKQDELLEKIYIINKEHLIELEGKEDDVKNNLIQGWLSAYNLSVFPESAAGVNYLLKTKRLANGAYATLDIGAGTSDIAIFKVKKDTLENYFCSESVEIAINDFYREYAKKHFVEENISFENIREVENIIKEDNEVNNEFYRSAINAIRGNDNGKGIEFAIRKTFMRKYYKPYLQIKRSRAEQVLTNDLNGKPIIVFGGGASLMDFRQGSYFYYTTGQPYGRNTYGFEAKAITDYVGQVDITDENDEIQNSINLLILALGLTYVGENDNILIPHFFPDNGMDQQDITPAADRYFYYDIQDAAYK